MKQSYQSHTMNPYHQAIPFSHAVKQHNKRGAVALTVDVADGSVVVYGTHINNEVNVPTRRARLWPIKLWPI